MSRGISTAMAAALAKPNVKLFDLLELQFVGGTERVVSLDFDVTYGGYTWMAGLGVLAISACSEASATAGSIDISISGVSSSNVALALNERVRGRKVILSLACIDDGTLIVTPNVWTGTMQAIRLSRSEAGDDVVVIRCVSRMADLDQPMPRRYTDAEQQAMYPGDTACRHVKNAERSIVWPSADFWKQ